MLKSSLAKPEWIRVKTANPAQVQLVSDLKKQHRLHTVCESALCPNLAECWAMGHATFMILGNGCTRRCSFCAVSKIPQPIDHQEPERLAEAVVEMGLKHAVITSVTRDDVADGGAGCFAETIRHIRSKCADITIEVLVPDFSGRGDSIKTVVEASPDIFGHNIETIPGLYPKIRPEADFNRSLEVIKIAKSISPNLIIKSGIMVGLGETEIELIEVIKILKTAGVDILTIGQYLQPSRHNAPVKRYYHPDEFSRLKKTAMNLNFLWVESGPFVRSSYKAYEQARVLCKRKDSTGNAADPI